MTAVLILRNNLFLDERYDWQPLPVLFPTWHAKTMLEVMTGERIRQKPTGIAVVDDSKVIDLDTLEVRKIWEA